MKEEVKGYKIHELPEDERPREKLERYGASFLSDAELLAILLQTGTKEKNAVELSEALLNHIRREGGITNVDIKDLMQVKGIGRAKATKVIAAVEFVRRFLRKSFDERISLDNPKAIFDYIHPKLKSEQREYLCVLLLDIKCRLIYDFEIPGNASSVSIEPKTIFEKAVRRQANSIVLVHNHPSGDISPSVEDRRLTDSVLKAGRMLGISMVDHIIIGDNDYFSFNKAGFLE